MPNQKRACTDEALCEASKFKSIASQFHRLSKRFEEYRQQDVKAGHLSVNLGESQVRAGRLLVAAIDAGAFPKSMSQQNCEWWDRTIGRLPGSVFTISPDGFRWRKGEPPPGESPEFVAAASNPLDPAQLARCWTFAIGSWLVPKFPSRFRHNAAGKDWTHVLLDRETGRPVDKDGKVLRGRWFKDGKPLPYDFQHTPDLRDGNYEWKLEGEPAVEHEKYDEADWLHVLRARAEVYAEACELLAEMVARSSVRFSSDENELTDGASGGKTAAARIPMTKGQKGLWDALDGHILSAKELASESELNTSEDTVRQWVRELRAASYSIDHRTGRGYFRPDAPPQEILRHPE